MKSLFLFIESKEISPNSFYILWCIANAHTPKVTNPYKELRELQEKGMITAEYKLTEEGAKILKDAEKKLGKIKVNEKEILTSDEEQEYINQYLELFPRGRLPSGKSARVNKKDIEKAFKWFFGNYTYSWDTILKATAYYVDSYEKMNFMYMRNSQYFIGKTNPDKTKDSDLASYCEIILNGGHDEEGNKIIDRVV